jgi:hypothetical protein
MATRPKATIKDLYHLPEDGKAEIVNGELISRSLSDFHTARVFLSGQESRMVGISTALQA